MENIFYVYLHRFPNGVLYVGKGKGRRAFNKKDRNEYWKRVAKKHGYPIVRILRNHLDEKAALDLEVSLIAKLKDKGKELCNITNGGEGTAGLRQTEKQKLKYCNTAGYKRFHFVKIDGSDDFFGYQWEFRAYIGDDSVASAVSQLCSGHLKSWIGWKLAETTEFGKAGKRHHQYNPTILNLYNAETGATFQGTAYEFKQANKHISPSCVTTMLQGKTRHAHGWLPIGMEYKGKYSGCHESHRSKKIHSFKHVETGLIIQSTIHEFKTKNPHISPSAVTMICKGNAKSAKGWQCLTPESISG